MLGSNGTDISSRVLVARRMWELVVASCLVLNDCTIQGPRLSCHSLDIRDPRAHGPCPQVFR
jgi:hypothetical protein